MTEFINFEVGFWEEDIEVSDSDLNSLPSFIDNEETENVVNFYHNFNNIETDIEQTLKAEYDRGLEEIENYDEISNLCKSLEDETNDEFENAAEKV